MRHIYTFLKMMCIRFFADLVPTRAASLAYTTLLSIVPLMIFVFHVLSFFPPLQNSGSDIEQFILKNFIADSAAIIAMHLQQFIFSIQVFSWINILALALVGFLLILNVIDAVNGVWHVKMTRRSIWATLFYFLISFIAPILLALLLLISSYLTTLPLISQVTEFQLLKRLILYLSPLLIEWLAFTIFNWITPSCLVKFRYAIIAGFITMFLFEVAKWGFVQYLHYFPAYQLIYGALATIPIFFVWVFLSWSIVILGALICHLLQDTYSVKKTLS